MKLRRVFLFAFAGIIFPAAAIFADGVQSTNGEIVTPAVYVPDYAHANDPLPDGVLAWNSLSQSTNAAADLDQVTFIVGFTNISSGDVIIWRVHPGCGCTMAQLPSLPWTIPPGTNGEFPVTVNLNMTGHEGTLVKSISIFTDKGTKELYFQITAMPPVVPTMTEADRVRGVTAAKIDRQAVFRGDCATCHVQRGNGKYGLSLFQADCAICHEAQYRATIVPDLQQLKVPTNDDFWRTWIAHGKPGSLMPAFSQSDGGPLTDMQIASLAAYLDTSHPSRVPTPAQ